MITENNPGEHSGQPKDGIARNTPQQMMNLLQVQALSLNMNNAVSSQQNAQMLNAAVVTSICTRILAAGKHKEQQSTAN